VAASLMPATKLDFNTLRRHWMPKITPFLWFDKQAGEAANFYVSIFKNSKVLKNTPMIVQFMLDGQEFTALNAGPRFKFTEAVSFVVDCKSQDEVDYYWSKLTADGGQESQCGWLKDKYGLSWQIIPDALPRLIGDPDRQKAKRAMEAMLKMKKIDIAGLQRAHDQE
jgi:predicted 3-demethylubiquinone-9 3-methyltransferase (glyoxalase superfamily)